MEFLKFDWEIINISSTSMELKLTFENPNYVSVYAEKDVISIHFWRTHTFMADLNDEHKLIVPSGYFIIHALPMLDVATSMEIMDKEQIK